MKSKCGGAERGKPTFPTLRIPKYCRRWKFSGCRLLSSGYYLFEQQVVWIDFNLYGLFPQPHQLNG